MTFPDYKQFAPNPGEVWSVSAYDDRGIEEPGTYVYYFIEKLPPTLASARFASSLHTWRVLVLEGDYRLVAGVMLESQLDGVSTGYGPDGHEHSEGCDSYDNYYTRLA